MTDELAAWALSLWESVGGADWRTDLARGGIVSVAALLIVCGLLTVAVLRGARR